MLKRGCEPELTTVKSKAKSNRVARVRNRFAAANGVAVIVVGLAACANPVTLTTSKAAVKINGNTAVNTDHVECREVQELMLIDIADNAGRGKLLVDENGATPIVKSVHIENLGGFTGMYSEGGAGNANLTVSGESVRVTGVAEGFNTDSNQPASAAFDMTVRC